MSPEQVLQAVFPDHECDDEEGELTVQLARAKYDVRCRAGAWLWSQAHNAHITYSTYMRGEVR